MDLDPSGLQRARIRARALHTNYFAWLKRMCSSVGAWYDGPNGKGGTNGGDLSVTLAPIVWSDLANIGSSGTQGIFIPMEEEPMTTVPFRSEDEYVNVASRRLVGQIKGVNSEKGTNNCINVAMHTEQTLVSGRLSVATLDGGTQRLMVLADAYGHSDLISATSISEVSAYSTGQNNILHLAGIRKTG